MKDFKNLSSALVELQSETIGVANIHGNIELVVEDNESIFVTISLGKLGGYSTNHYPKPDFSFERFPEEYQSLWNFLNKPFEFNDWYQKHFYKD